MNSSRSSLCFKKRSHQSESSSLPSFLFVVLANARNGRLCVSESVSSSENFILSSTASNSLTAASGCTYVLTTACSPPRCQRSAITCEHIPTSRAPDVLVHYHPCIGCCSFSLNCRVAMYCFFFECRD